MSDKPSTTTDDDGFAYREDVMKARLNPIQFRHYQAMPLSDQLVIAHHVVDGLAYPAALLKLSQLKEK